MAKTVKYQGVTYRTDLKEDEKGAGGIWDLAGAFASTISIMTDPSNYSHYEEIQEELYNLVKYGVIEELNKGSELC